MPSVYPPDPRWARIMHESVRGAVGALSRNPGLPLQEVLGGLIQTVRLPLEQHSRTVLAPSSYFLSHAPKFGYPRTHPHSRARLFFGEASEYKAFRPLAISRLKEGGRQETSQYWNPLDPQGQGKLHIMSSRLEFSYPDTEGVIPLGRLTGSLWVPGHNDPRMNQPWGRMIYESATPEVIPSMLRAADRAFQGVIRIAQDLDGGSRSQDEPTLTSIVDHAAKVYWLLSHAWPYKRGSACIADLSTKVIFDRLGIEVPAFKPEHYPNINALFSPVEMFRPDYPSFFQGAFRWAR